MIFFFFATQVRSQERVAMKEEHRALGALLHLSAM